MLGFCQRQHPSEAFAATNPPKREASRCFLDQLAGSSSVHSMQTGPDPLKLDMALRHDMKCPKTNLPLHSVTVIPTQQQPQKSPNQRFSTNPRASRVVCSIFSHCENQLMAPKLQVLVVFKNCSASAQHVSQSTAESVDCNSDFDSGGRLRTAQRFDMCVVAVDTTCSFSDDNKSNTLQVKHVI